MDCARIRATESVDPPGGNCKTMRMGFVGQDCAMAQGAVKAKQKVTKEWRRIFVMKICTTKKIRNHLEAFLDARNLKTRQKIPILI